MMRAPSRILLAAVLAVPAALLALSSLSRRAAADDGLPPPKAVPGAGSTARTAMPTPRTAVAVSAEYQISAGDEIEIEISVPAASEADNPVREPKRILVGRGGTLELPRVHGVRLEGRTVGDVQRDVAQKLTDAKVATAAEVFVRVVSYVPRYVGLVGAVWQRIEVSPFEPARLLWVLAQAGQSLDAADTTRVRVISLSGGMRAVDVTALLSAGGATPDGMLLPGDLVLLAPKPPKAEAVVPRVWVAGAVKSSASYRYWTGPNETQPITLVKALTAAGWITEYGKLKSVIVRRFTEKGASVQTVNVVRIIEGQDPDLILQPDDLVWVPE